MLTDLAYLTLLTSVDTITLSTLDMTLETPASIETSAIDTTVTTDIRLEPLHGYYGVLKFPDF
jgi:hypothetical protein